MPKTCKRKISNIFHFLEKYFKVSLKYYPEKGGLKFQSTIRTPDQKGMNLWR